ncbi:MAG: aminodeoxychorismate/anthranilate synthase component II [Marinilabiliales bacterium]
MHNRILLIDNFDSFTYNLYHYVKEYTDNCKVIRYDKINIEHLSKFSGIIFSPGPGSPDDYPLLKEIINQYKSVIPIFGICLGLQVIGSYFGCRIKNMHKVYHGKQLKTKILDKKHAIFSDIPEMFYSGRYHSWCIEVPEEVQDIKITATDEENNIIMAIKHSIFPVEGVQFHPESIMTSHGKKMISNWLNSLS